MEASREPAHTVDSRRRAPNCRQDVPGDRLTRRCRDRPSGGRNIGRLAATRLGADGRDRDRAHHGELTGCAVTGSRRNAGGEAGRGPASERPGGVGGPVGAVAQGMGQGSTADSRAAAADLRGLAEFFDWNHDYLRALEGKVAALRRTAEQDRLLIGKLVDDLLENSKKLLMLPLARLAGLLSKLVRDLCRDQGKEAELTIRGEEVTIDKRILEQLKDPLVHLLRNCIDHGIETPEQRRRAGKPPRAAITLAVSPVNSTQVEISVSDDGVGIDVDKVKAVAGKRGLVTLNTLDQLSESAALALVFETDVSTSPMITRISGRGLGLAIVREKVEKLGGRVAIESRRGFGTTIRMTLPPSFSAF